MLQDHHLYSHHQVSSTATNVFWGCGHPVFGTRARQWIWRLTSVTNFSLQRTNRACANLWLSERSGNVRIAAAKPTIVRYVPECGSYSLKCKERIMLDIERKKQKRLICRRHEQSLDGIASPIQPSRLMFWKEYFWLCDLAFFLGDLNSAVHLCLICDEILRVSRWAIALTTKLGVLLGTPAGSALSDTFALSSVLRWTSRRWAILRWDFRRDLFSRIRHWKRNFFF